MYTCKSHNLSNKCAKSLRKGKGRAVSLGIAETLFINASIKVTG